MKLKVIGGINTNAAPCLKCNYLLNPYGKMVDLNCLNCGAFYKFSSSRILNDNVEIEFDFNGYACMFQAGWKDKCLKECPLPNMYCKEHCSDKIIDYAKKDIENSEQRVVEAKNKLSALEESKKVWLINEVSGIDDGENK